METTATNTQTKAATFTACAAQLPCIEHTYFDAYRRNGATDGQPVAYLPKYAAEHVARLIREGQPHLQVIIEPTPFEVYGEPLYTIRDNETDLYIWELTEEETIETMEGERMTQSEVERMGLNFCEHYEQYTEEPTFSVHYQRQLSWRIVEEQWSEQAIENARIELMEYENEYYDRAALEYFDLCYNEDTGAVDNQCDCYQWEDGSWHSDEEETEEYVAPYHSSDNGRPVYFNASGERSPYLIGYEIEKEDTDAKYRHTLRDMREDTTAHRWRKETDGSLDGQTGFELISPPYELDIEKIEQQIKTHPILRPMIDADYSSNCGGHIHLSKLSTSGTDLYKEIQGYTPLLHAMYHNRAENISYCRAKSIEKMKAESVANIGNAGRYQAVNIMHDRIEFRIFSAVRNVNNLIWRTRLIELMLKHPTDDPRRAFYNIHTELKEHLSKVYDSPRKWENLRERIVNYTLKFENIDPRDGQTTLF